MNSANIKIDIMKIKDEHLEQLETEIQHIFDSGVNEVRIYNMVKNFIEKREVALFIPVVSNSLPNEVKCMLIESEYRLQQAIDIFNGTTNLNSTKENKYSKMVECANNINEYLKGNDC